MFDAAAGFGGVKQSGFGREGGWEGLLAYSKPKNQFSPKIKSTLVKNQISKADYIDRTAKLYIGENNVAQTVATLSQFLIITENL